MKISTICNLINDAKDWVYKWDDITYTITVILICFLMVLSSVSLLKGFFAGKFSFKFIPFLFLGLLTAGLVMILMIRL